MPDLSERFRQLDRIEPPDLWPAVLERSVDAPALLPERARVPLPVAAALSVATVAAATLLVLVATGRIEIGEDRPLGSTLPGNGRLVFAQAGDLFSILPDGSGLVRLTDTATVETDPAWSPDGNTIVFGREGIVAMDVASGGERQLTTGSPESLHGFEWSPDGSRIAFYNTLRGLEIIGADGNGRAVLLAGGESSCCGILSWSPDGKLLLTSTGDGRLLVVPADGGNPVELAMQSTAWSAAWSSDGARVIFWSDPGEPARKPHVEIINVDGTGRRVLADGLAPTWSPLRDRIAFTGPDPGQGIYLLDPNRASAPVFIASGRGPLWSPDGSLIAFVRNDGLYVVDAAGGEARLLRSDSREAPIFMSSASWQPVPH